LSIERKKNKILSKRLNEYEDQLEDLCIQLQKVEKTQACNKNDEDLTSLKAQLEAAHAKEEALGLHIEQCDRHEEIANKVIKDLKLQVEESRIIEEALKLQIKEKDASHYKLEEEIVSLRKKLDEANKQLSNNLKFEKSTKVLDDILKQQRDPKIKFGLGYVAEQPSSSKATEKKTSNVVGTRRIKLNHQRLWKKIRKLSTEDQITRRDDIKEKLINTINQVGHKNKEDLQQVKINKRGFIHLIISMIMLFMVIVSNAINMVIR